MDRPLILLDGRSPAEFLRDYWQKQPLLVRGALPDFQSPIAPEELAGLACEEGVESRLVLERGGDRPWQLRHGPFAEDDFLNLPETHWTLLVQAVDRLLPEVEALLDPLAFLPRWRIDDVMVSYAPEGGSVGAHIDSYDVFLIQGLGRRRWQIETMPTEDETLVPDLDVRVLADFAPDEDWVLEPGDLLYLPPRIAHHGVALDDCMTFSVGFRAPSHREIVSGFLEDALARLDRHARYADPDLTPADHPGRIRPDALERVRAVIRGVCEGADAIDRWFGRSVTAPERGYRLSPLDPSLTPDALAGAIHEGAGLRTAPAARLAYVERAGGTLLFAGGETYDLDADLAYAAPLLTDRRVLPAEALRPHLGDTAFVELLSALVNAGVFEREE